MKAFGQEDFQLQAFEVGARVAKQRFRLAIHQCDMSGRIDQDQRVGQNVQQCEEGHFADLPLQGNARHAWRMK